MFTDDDVRAWIFCGWYDDAAMKRVEALGATITYPEEDTNGN